MPETPIDKKIWVELGRPGWDANGDYVDEYGQIWEHCRACLSGYHKGTIGSDGYCNCVNPPVKDQQ